MSLDEANKGARPRKPRKHRNRFGIIGDILAIAQRGERKTHIMYRANLSFGELNQYLRFLMEQGLIERRLDQEEHAVTFRTTQNGFDFMRTYEDLRGLITPYEDNNNRRGEKEVALGSL